MRRVVLADAASCAGMAVALSVSASVLPPVTGLSATLLYAAGIALYPVAAFLAWAGTRRAVPPSAVWLAVAGNAAWVAGSLWVLFGVDGITATGVALVLAQAVAVAVLTELEYVGLRRRARSKAMPAE